MWGINNNGDYIEINGKHSIRLNKALNSVKFVAEYSGFVYAYVVGDFNNWEKRKEHKMKFSLDPSDTKTKFIKDIVFKDGLEAGIYRYTYVLGDEDGNEIFLKSRSGVNPYFEWNGKLNGIDVKSSSDSIYIDEEVELIAVKTKKQGKLDIIEVKWKALELDTAIEIKGNKLLFNGRTTKKQIKVQALGDDGKVLGEKIINLVNKKRYGTLVHFIKSDEEYLGDGYLWDLWCFDYKRGERAVGFSEKTDFGVAAFVEHRNVIARRKTWGDNWHNDWSDQTMTFTLNKDIKNYYIVYGDGRVYKDLRRVLEATRPRIESAIMDSAHKITAYLSHEPVGTYFNIYVNGEIQKDINVIIKSEKRRVYFTNLPLNISTSDLVEVRATNTFIPCKVTMRGFLDNFYYIRDDMGIKFSKDDITLRLWAPTAKDVEVLIYDSYKTQNNEPLLTYKMKHNHASGTHFISLDREFNENKYYVYRLYFDDINRNGSKFTKITYAVDPYAVGLSVNGDKGCLLDINDIKTKPTNWNEDTKPKLKFKNDSVIYEMHVRDFTIDSTSGVSDKLKGTYLGAIEKGTKYLDVNNGIEVKTGIDHLIELGITHIHLLPIFDFGSVDERYPNKEGNRNWGYDPKNYNAPEGSYSTDPFNPMTRVKELRTMIQGFHNAGIRVVMDMVYNHMYDTRNFDNIVPGYYFRTNRYGRFTNGSGCGNELATERPMVSKFILDSITNWLVNYNIDGLRFDLMELMDFDTMQKIVAKANTIGENILIYGEPWKGGDSPLENCTYKGRQKNMNFSIFNDQFRDAIRGDNSPSNGFINGNQHNKNIGWSIIEGLKGSIHSVTDNSSESINYIDAHDNYTLWDQIEKSLNHYINQSEYRNLNKDYLNDRLVQRYILGIGILLTAQGIPFLHGGIDFLRTKKGNHNSYNSSDDVNAVRWDDKSKFYDVFKYIQSLIRIRKKYKSFRINSKQKIVDNMDINFYGDNENSGVIISKFDAKMLGDDCKNIVIAYNATDIDNYDINSEFESFDTSSNWKIILDTSREEIDFIEVIQKGKIPPLKKSSMMILVN